MTAYNGSAMVTKQTRSNPKRKREVTAKYKFTPANKDASPEKVRELGGSIRAIRPFRVMDVLERD